VLTQDQDEVSPPNAEPIYMTTKPIVHRLQGAAFPVNAYLIESPTGLVLVDSMLTVSDGRAIRARIAALKKPLLGAIVTHAHPDHYGALVEIVGEEQLPIVATEGVARAIRRDDPAKELILRPMFGDEWPKERVFPNQTIANGEAVSFGGLTLTVTDLGPGESPHDSVWSLQGSEVAFVGDLVYNHMHAYLADGFHDRWLDNLVRARSLFAGSDMVLYPGHGEPASPALLDWQAAYIRTFLGAARGVRPGLSREAGVEEVTRHMKAFLGTDDLLFLMQLSVPAFTEQ
jgi:glyoxylase-like metal-dependent hydrolase (beta-lactamase superfamily II)